MNLVAYISGTVVAGYKLVELQDILLSRHNTIRITSKGSGLIVLSDGKLLKCVSNYYDSGQEIKKSRSSSNQCFEVQKTLGVPRTVGVDCASCHFNCSVLLTEERLSVK